VRQRQSRRSPDRDGEWRQAIARRDAEQLKQQQERARVLQTEAMQKTRWAKQAARVNTRGSPGHATNPKTMDATLREIADRVYG
jgi:hypothetical protein